MATNNQRNIVNTMSLVIVNVISIGMAQWPRVYSWSIWIARTDSVNDDK